jgi:hypothetical protein
MRNWIGLILFVFIFSACATKVPLPTRAPYVPPPPPPIEIWGVMEQGFIMVSQDVTSLLNKTDWTGHPRPASINLSAQAIWIQPKDGERFVRGVQIKATVYMLNGTSLESLSLTTDQAQAAKEGQTMGQFVAHAILNHIRNKAMPPS